MLLVYGATVMVEPLRDCMPKGICWGKWAEQRNRDLQKWAENPRFPASVLLTDELYFTRECIFNTLNNHAWAIVNQHVICTWAAQTHFMVHVWTGIAGDRLNRPYLFMITWIVHTTWYSWNTCYQNYWTTHTFSLQCISSLHDRDPINFSLSVRNHLNATSDQLWISLDGPMHWCEACITCGDHHFGHFLWYELYFIFVSFVFMLCLWTESNKHLFLVFCVLSLCFMSKKCKMKIQKQACPKHPHLFDACYCISKAFLTQHSHAILNNLGVPLLPFKVYNILAGIPCISVKVEFKSIFREIF